MERKILVIEDTPLNVENAGKSNLNPFICYSAKEAIEVLKSDDFFAVLTDMDLETPESGIEVVNYCAEHSIPVAVVTGGEDHGEDLEKSVFLSYRTLEYRLCKVQPACKRKIARRI